MACLGHVSPFGPTSCKQRAGGSGVMGNRVYSAGTGGTLSATVLAKRVMWIGKKSIGEGKVLHLRILQNI